MAKQNTSQKTTCCNMSIMQQVQLVVGTMVLAGSLITWLVSPLGLLLTFMAGLGLIQASITGICPMEKAIARMPWNCKK